MSLETPDRRLRLGRPGRGEHRRDDFERWAERRAARRAPDAEHRDDAVAAGDRNREHRAFVRGVRERFGERGVGGETAQGGGGVGRAVVELAEAHRLAKRLHTVKGEAHADHARRHLGRETLGEGRRRVHRHDDGNVRLDRADDCRDVECGKRCDDLGRGLLDASSPRQAVSELRQDVKAQV